MMKRFVFWTFAFSIIFLLFGCQQQNETKQDNQEDQNVALEPEQTYQNNCASCHGQSLEGSLGPSLDKIGSKLSKEEIATIIEKGKDSMPSQPQVSAQAREKLAEWLAAKK